MSKSYKVIDNVAFCKDCNKPIHYHTIEKFHLCDCPPKTVKMRVRDYSYEEVDYEYFEGLDIWFTRYERVYKGWKTVEETLPRGKYYRNRIKVPDCVEGWLHQNEGRKRYQEAANRSYRAKSKQVLRNRNKDWEDKVFPRNGNSVNWEMF